MTPTEQTRLEAIKAVHAKTIPQGIYQADMRFLLSLLSQETKRADEAEAVAWESVAARADKKIAECDSIHAKCVWADARDFATKEAAALRRGREGE